MLNVIWSAFILCAIGIGFINGQISNVNQAIFVSAQNALEMLIQMVPVLCFFCGILKVAKAAGIIDKVVEYLQPIMGKLFPNVPKNHSVISMISFNIVANAFGMGNAATVFGLKAMDELQQLNQDKNKVSHEMCLFVILNIYTVALFPTSIISLRFAEGSSEPAGILGMVTGISMILFLFGIILCKIFSRIWK